MTSLRLSQQLRRSLSTGYRPLRIAHALVPCTAIRRAIKRIFRRAAEVVPPRRLHYYTQHKTGCKQFYSDTRDRIPKPIASKRKVNTYIAQSCFLVVSELFASFHMDAHSERQRIHSGGNLIFFTALLRISALLQWCPLSFRNPP